ncbi:MAG: HAD family hydrolase [Candidatus Heimdallarchaeota archaeon]|nr:HAD family hydrolase [Candidatus Heimdallarchaeota archaeon]
MLSKFNRPARKETLIKLLCFDLGDTLYPSTLQVKAWKSAFFDLGISGTEFINTYYFGNVDFPLGTGAFSTAEVVELVNNSLDAPISRSLIPALLKLYQSKFGVLLSQFIASDPYGTFNYLKSLSTRFNLGILSDNSVATRDFWQEHLNKNNLDIFDFFIVSEEIGFSKPHQKMFDKLIKLSHLEPAEIIYFGDNLTKDQAVEKYGIKFVHVSGFNHDFPAMSENSIRTVGPGIEQILTNLSQ